MSYQRICIFAHKSSFSSRYICSEMRVKIEFKNVGRLSNGEGSYVALSWTFRMLRNSMERWLGCKLQLSFIGKIIFLLLENSKSSWNNGLKIVQKKRNSDYFNNDRSLCMFKSMIEVFFHDRFTIDTLEKENF